MSFFSGLFSGVKNLLGGLFGGGGLGSILGGGANYFGQREANQSNLAIARETNAANRGIADTTNAANAKQVADLMKWQEGMSNTAYQRQMADMKKAGINPMLAASMGGASTPPGASIPQTTGAPSMTGAPMQNALGPAVHSAIDALRLKNEVTTMQANVKNLLATNKKIMSDTALNKALIHSAENDAVLKANSAKVAGRNAQMLEYALPGAKTESDIDSSLYGKVLRYGSRMNPFAHSARDISAATGFAGRVVKRSRGFKR